MVTGVIEQVPRYTIRHTDDGRQERLHLTVSLPGLTSAKDFEVRIENDKFILRAEGRYNLTLPLHPPVEQTAEVLQFVKRKALLKAELKVLPASDRAAAQSASPVSPASSAASSSLANQSDEADGFRRRHVRKQAPDPETDDEALPDLLSNDSGSSPTFSSPDAFPGHANGTAFTASGRGMSPDSDSDQSVTSPHVRRWSNGAGPMPAAEESADAAMHSNPLYGVSPASQAPHGDTESSDDDADHSEHPYHPFQQPQTQQTLEAAAAYCKQAFESLYACEWQRAANLLLEAQLLEGSTSGLVHVGMGGFPASLAADVRRNVGAFLLENIEERMQANGSGAAKTVRGAWEQAHAVLLLQAIGHPAAARYGLPGPADASTDRRQEQRTPQAKPPGPSTSSQPSDFSFPQTDAAHSNGTQPSAAEWPSSARSARADQDSSGSETSEQEQQHGQWAPGPTPASYGPAEQAEAKRQANKEAALTWLDKARAAAANKDYTAAVHKAQKGLSLDPDTDWAREANRLILSWQAVQQKPAGSSGPADKQSGGSKPHAQGGKGQQQQQSKKQTKKQKRQAQQQQQAKQQKQEQQAKQQQQQQQPKQQPKQEQQQQSGAQQHKRPREEAFGDRASGSAAHGQYSYTYGPQGQRTESAEPWMNSPPAEYFDWLSAVLPLMKYAAGCARRGCGLLLHGLVRSAVIGAAFVLLCVLMVPQIPAGLLYLSGRRDWCHQLAAARKAGKVWARLVYFVLSPLLGLIAASVMSSFISRGSFAGSFVMTISWVAWPLVKAWEQLKSATSWLHPSRASLHVILLIARVITRPSWVRYLSSGLLLWWSLPGGWTAVVITLLASLVSYMFCLETLGTPVAFKLSHVALTNTYITGYFYRAVMLILVWGCWVFWQAVWRECTGPADQPHADADPPPKPASGAPRPAQPGPTRTSSTDAKTEVTRILAAKTHYAVLEVEHSADEDTVKRAKKTKSLLVHPDKAGNLAGAGDAFGKVIDAAEVLSDPSKKRQYDAEQAAAAYKPSQPAAPPRRPQEEDDPNVSWQLCPLCEQLHRAVKIDMPQNDARWCKDCNAYHTVHKGEGWVTRRGRGLWSFLGGVEYVVYACLWPDGQIYDVTEQCICQGMLEAAAFRQLGPDCHHVWLHFSNPEAANRRQRYQPPDQSAGGRKKSKKAPRRRR